MIVAVSIPVGIALIIRMVIAVGLVSLVTRLTRRWRCRRRLLLLRLLLVVALRLPFSVSGRLVDQR
jgi:hypothetical protein